MSDTGLNKAVVLVPRLNRFFSTGWEAVPDYYKNEPAKHCHYMYDNVKSRLDIAAGLLPPDCYRKWTKGMTLKN
ncbi:MAG: hypothetical protein LBL33_08255 [Tannerella sp.]|nr:hypothetical protein [Tannerella sp.]